VERAAFVATDPAALRSYFGGLKRLDILVNSVASMTIKPFAILEPEDLARTRHRLLRGHKGSAARAERRRA
jgi:hypothetical protein